MTDPRGHAPSLRIDKFLWYGRLSKSRSLAQSLAERGIVRLNGRRVDKAHMPVRVGDLITVPYGERIRVLRVLALPIRRGPPAEAAGAYEDLEIGGMSLPKS